MTIAYRMFKRTGLTALLSIVFVAAGVGTALAQPRAGATWSVQKYDVNVTLPTDERSRSVAVRAALDLRNVSSGPAGTLTLRITSQAEVSAVQLNGKPVEITKSEEKINAATSLQRVAMRFPAVAPGGPLAATVDYKLNIKDNGPLAAVSSLGTQFLPLSFWYPTPNSWFFTKGPDMAPVRLKVSAPAGSQVISSGIEVTGAFEQKMGVQPFFVARDWAVSDRSGVSLFLPKGGSGDGQRIGNELAGLFTEARAFYETFLGKPPDTPLKIVATGRGAGFSSSGTVLVDEAVFRRSKVDSLTAMNVAEAAAKLWLGGALTVNGEGYGVITEGMARYLATEFIESKFGKDVADIERLRQRTSYAAVSRRDAPMGMVAPLDDYYYPAVANKGAMAWRLLAKRLGANEFWSIVRANAQDGDLNVAELRAAFSAQKPLVDELFDKVTEMDLLVGLPQSAGGETRVAVRNTGTSDVTVDVAATTADGERIVSPTTIRAASFGEVAFRTTKRIVRVEIDAEKLYPQTDYADDVKPQIVTDSDPVLAAKRPFDQQKFAEAEATARELLKALPRHDDLRVLLGRALLAQNKNSDADREFRAVLDEKLPTARSFAWANVGLAEVAARSNRTADAMKLIDAAILSDAEYGASLAARTIRNRLGQAAAIDPTVKAFFAEFDKAATANRKADVDALVMPGEITRFTGGVAGSTEQWQTTLLRIDRLDPNTILVETETNIKLLNGNPESRTAVYRLVRMGSGWKMAAVDMFEVR